MEWIDGNLGSKLTMKYPSVYLKGKGARADILSIAYAAVHIRMRVRKSSILLLTHIQGSSQNHWQWVGAALPIVVW